ncbi:hypothetical protein HYR99_01800 [Candidatus Poribacteria bacterium]|nr:hypothetical protein [Candidatus Poribacteria bacterium]
MNEQLLKRITEITSKEYGLLRELSDNSYLDLQPVEDAIHQIVAERLKLAQDYLNFASSIANTSPSNCRQIISRSYYAMHHAARAVIFETRRRDNRSHEAVITEIAQIMGADVSVTLKAQLDLRNSVEYELYLLNFDFQGKSTSSLGIASAFFQSCQEFIRKRRET